MWKEDRIIIKDEPRSSTQLSLTPLQFGEVDVGTPLNICVGGSLGFSLSLCLRGWDEAIDVFCGVWLE